ncbi:hypothetical protein GQ600_19711 [Phytophthora cactorum]|nr:hypothetical protein GQ600_19711 [Phytophthora cactorum]
MALDCVSVSIADSQQLRQDVEALVRRLDAQDKALASRKSIIEGFLHNNALPPASAVIHYRQWNTSMMSSTKNTKINLKP